MYVCVYVNTCLHAGICIKRYICIYIHTCIHTYIHGYISGYVYLYLHSFQSLGEAISTSALSELNFPIFRPWRRSPCDRPCGFVTPNLVGGAHHPGIARVDEVDEPENKRWSKREKKWGKCERKWIWKWKHVRRWWKKWVWSLNMEKHEKQRPNEPEVISWKWWSNTRCRNKMARIWTGTQIITDHLSICRNIFLVCWLLSYFLARSTPLYHGTNTPVKSIEWLPKCIDVGHVCAKKCCDFRTQRIATGGVCFRVNREIQEVIGSRKSWCNKRIQDNPSVPIQSPAKLKSSS